jgi:hypothetical protein
MFSIVSSEVDRGSLRLRFLAGNRVLAALQQSLCREQQLSVILSVAPAEQAKVVDSLLQDKKAFTKAMKATDEELSLLLASHVVQRYRSRLDDASTGIVPAIVLHRPGASLPFLQAMAECILQMSDDLKLDIKVLKREQCISRFLQLDELFIDCFGLRMIHRLCISVVRTPSLSLLLPRPVRKRKEVVHQRIFRNTLLAPLLAMCLFLMLLRKMVLKEYLYCTVSHLLLLH